MSLYPHISTESMEWDSFVVTGEPGTTADFFVESISSDESEESTDSSDADTDESPYSTEDNDVETDESPNLIEDCYDNIINDNPFEDLDFQNFLDAEIRDINDRLDAEIQDLHVMRDSLNEIGDAADKKIQETHAMVLGSDTEEEPDSELLALFLADYTDGELEDSEESESDTEEEPDSELLALFLADYTKEELEDSEESESGYGIYQAADIDEGIPMEINGLGPQQSSLQKIVDWLVNME